MPSRIIREGWLESERINELDAAGERFFLRLCLRADDFGRYHANPILLKSGLYPLAETVRSTDIPRWIAACEKAGLIRCYDVDGKRFIEIHRFEQRTRAKNSKFPAPPPLGTPLTDTCPSSASHVRTDSDSESDAKSEKARPASAGPTPAASPAKAPLPLALQTPEFEAAWADWLKHRSEIRHPIKPGSQTELGTIRAFQVMGPTRAAAAIRYTILKGWRGIREPDPTDRAFQSAPARSAPAAPSEPPGWKLFLNKTYPESRFAYGQLNEAKAWADLPLDVQSKLAREMGKANAA